MCTSNKSKTDINCPPRHWTLILNQDVSFGRSWHARTLRARWRVEREKEEEAILQGRWDLLSLPSARWGSLGPRMGVGVRAAVVQRTEQLATSGSGELASLGCLGLGQAFLLLLRGVPGTSLERPRGGWRLI